MQKKPARNRQAAAPDPRTALVVAFVSAAVTGIFNVVASVLGHR